jgi:hypothetical protein
MRSFTALVLGGYQRSSVEATTVLIPWAPPGHPARRRTGKNRDSVAESEGGVSGNEIVNRESPRVSLRSSVFRRARPTTRDNLY